MTTDLDGKTVAGQINERFPGAVEEISGSTIVVKGEYLYSVAQFLKETPELDFEFLNTLVGTDYLDYLEVVYFLESFKHNHRLFLKARSYDRDNPTLPSVMRLWKGADQQEREVYDLVGVRFTGHPRMKRIVMWAGFDGHPLRRDFL